jgi:hypothetical protein
VFRIKRGLQCKHVLLDLKTLLFQTWLLSTFCLCCFMWIWKHFASSQQNPSIGHVWAAARQKLRANRALSSSIQLWMRFSSTSFQHESTELDSAVDWISSFWFSSSTSSTHRSIPSIKYGQRVKSGCSNDKRYKQTACSLYENAGQVIGLRPTLRASTF